MPQPITVESETWGRTTLYNLSEKSLEQLPEEPEPLRISLTKIEELDEDLNDDENIPVDEGPDRMKYTNLAYLQSSLFGTILEDTITQLRILVECNVELRIIKTKSDWGQLLRDKFSVDHVICPDELENIDLNNLGCNEYKIAKLDADRDFVTDVMIKTYVELCLNKSFLPIQDAIIGMLNIITYREDLIEEEAKNKILRKELYRQLRQQRIHIKSTIYDAEVKVDALKTEVEDSFLISECKGRYIDNWQRARTEQHVATIHDDECVYSDSIHYYKQRSDNEHRVHLEVEMLTNIAISEILRKIEDQMEKYDKDIEAIDLRIQIQKHNYQNMLEKRLDLEATFVEHETLMSNWIEFKDKREKARQYHDKMTKSAIAVQAWWRGIIVRRQLGPFRPKRKPHYKKKP